MLSTPLLVLLAVAVLSTSFLAGVFGMAGGMILMGLLVYLMPVPAAMVLHGATMLASNGWRAVLWWRYADFMIVLRFSAGTLLALGVFSMILFVPSRAVVFITLGLVPFATLAVPERHAPRIDRRGAAEFCGFLGTCLQLLSGVSGPLLDSFFVRMPVDRRVIVATKAACQTLSHIVKLIYFGGIVVTAESAVTSDVLLIGIVCAIIGTTLARQLLDRLSNDQFRRWQRRIVLAIGTFYLAQGVIFLFV
jgi:uncharacterized protein